jgi:hypothetical protein
MMMAAAVLNRDLHSVENSFAIRRSRNTMKAAFGSQQLDYFSRKYSSPVHQILLAKVRINGSIIETSKVKESFWSFENAFCISEAVTPIKHETKVIVFENIWASHQGRRPVA